MNNIYSIHLFNKITFSVFIKIKDDKAFGIASLRRVGSGLDSANGLGQELSYSSLPLSSYTNRIISLHTLWSQKICIPFYPFADQQFPHFRLQGNPFLFLSSAFCYVMSTRCLMKLLWELFLNNTCLLVLYMLWGPLYLYVWLEHFNHFMTWWLWKCRL